MGITCFSIFNFSPRPFLFWGLYFEAKCQAPFVTAVAAVDLFDQGERRAQPRWFSEPSICFDHVCHKLPSPSCEFQVKEACLGQMLES